MNKDVELYIARWTTYKHMTPQRAYEAIAHDRGLNIDSVRRRVNRVNKIDANIELIRQTTQITGTNRPSIQRQNEVVKRSVSRFEAFNNGRIGKKTIGVFISDVHAPYQRMDAIELTLNILSDVKPHVVSVANDLLDNPQFSKHEDKRSHTAQLWSDDYAHTQNFLAAWYQSLKSVSDKDVQLIQVQGNHDAWFYSAVREPKNGLGEHQIANFMEWQEKQGVTQFARIGENFVKLAPSLVWWHGQFASSLATTNAKNTLSQFIEDGIAVSVVVGHTHRPAIIPGHMVGYSGVTFINNGCLCRLDGLPYMKRKPKGWGLGITICEYQTYGHVADDYVTMDLITYQERGGKLIARYAGKEYSVKLDINTWDDNA